MDHLTNFNRKKNRDGTVVMLQHGGPIAIRTALMASCGALTRRVSEMK
jgi:hypothetical protein